MSGSGTHHVLVKEEVCVVEQVMVYAVQVGCDGVVEEGCESGEGYLGGS